MTSPPEGYTGAMPATDPPKPLSELLDTPAFVMLMTMIGDEHTSRPLTCVEVEGDRLSFLVDRTTDWAQAVAEGRAVIHATVADERKNTWVAMNGDASIVQDQAEIDRLWNPGADAYFDKGDPAVAVLRIDVADGEYWDGPSGRIGAALQMLKAKFGDAEDAGEQGRIATTP